jgi:tRNA(Arg) A34 adenosine deaminase TadA
MIEKNNEFMKEAIRLALENVKNGGGPFGAVIVKNGEIVGRGVNRVTKNNDPTAHAEVNAIRDACSRLNSFQLIDCEIYSTCEPCPMCIGAIYWARPKKLYFASTKDDATAIDFDDSFIYKELELPYEKRKIETVSNFMRQESLTIFKAWTDKQDKIEY